MQGYAQRCETEQSYGVYQQQQPMQGYAQRCETDQSYGVYQQQQPVQGYAQRCETDQSYGVYQQQPLQKSSSYSKHSSSSMTLTAFGQDAFCDITPSSFPLGTDPKVVECFNRIDRNGNGVVDDKELQSVLSSCNHNFSLRTIHLLMYQFTHSNKRMIGPKEFLPLLNSLQTWKATFQRYDRDRNGRIDSCELGTALNCLGYTVSPCIVNMLISKFSTSASRSCSLQYDNFIECCLTVKGLSDTFKAKAGACGSAATFTYEEFLVNVLPYIIA